MSENLDGITSISCKRRTKKRIASKGMFGEGWDELLNKLLDIVDTIETLRRTDERLDAFNERIKTLL